MVKWIEIMKSPAEKGPSAGVTPSGQQPKSVELHPTGLVSTRQIRATLGKASRKSSALEVSGFLSFFFFFFLFFFFSSFFFLFFSFSVPLWASGAGVVGPSVDWSVTDVTAVTMTKA